MPASEEFWDDILGHLQQRVLVPFVGPELVTVVDGGRQTTLVGLLGERLAGKYKLDVAPDGGFHQAIRAFLSARGRDESERLYRIVNDLLIATNPATPDSLRQIAAITDLRVFISTTFDSLLARALDEVRFGGDAGTCELAFAPNQSTVDQQRNAKAPAPGQPVVFQLFGRASSTPQYALHDEDVLEWLHALLTDTARLPDWIEYQLRESPLLFIGCRIPDWVGRFLVRMASSTRLSLASKQFFIVGNSSSREPLLSEFFQTYCGSTRVQMCEMDPAEFVAELHERWRARNPEGTATTDSTAASPSSRGSIFISYVREDAEPARRLCDAITTLGGDVWFDEQRLQPGDEWNEEILTSIRRDIRLFVPVISRQTELRDEGYVFREWTDALKRADAILNRRFIVPVVIDPLYDGNADRFKQVQEGLRRFQFGHAPDGQPDDMLIATLTEEIRAMRRSVVA